MISFIIPCHNQEGYVAEAINSVANQTNKDIELIVVDDTSTDGSKQVILNSLGNLSIKSVYTYVDDVGPTNARLAGIKISEGEYYVTLDADDLISPDFAKETLSAIALTSEEIGFVYVDTVYFHDSISNGQRVPSPDYNLINLLNNNFMSYCSLFKRNTTNTVGYNTDNFGYFEDYDRYVDLGLHGIYGKHLAKDLFYYRVRKDSSFQSERTQQFSNAYKAHIVRKYPYVFDAMSLDTAKKILQHYPENFMSLKPHEQEKLLRTGG